MSSRILLAIAALAVAACTAQRTAVTDTARTVTQAGDVTSVRQQIDPNNQVFVDAMTRSDTTAVVRLYADDAQVLRPGSKVFRGHKAIASSLAAEFAGAKFADVTVATDDIIVGGDLAVQTGHYTLTYTPKGGKPTPDTGKFVTVWQRQSDGSYKIVRDIVNSDGPME